MKLTDIRIRDPFILANNKNKTYYLYGTTDNNNWGGLAYGFLAYTSQDLETWDGPFEVFKRTDEFWANEHFWAPEVHFYQNKYYMFASFFNKSITRATQILVADNPLGPFTPLTNNFITPKDWMSLDGTLFVENNRPFLVFAHEWLQIGDGTFCIMELSKDLKTAISKPQTILKASTSQFTIEVGDTTKGYITDGCFFYRKKNSDLILIWSSVTKYGYSVLTAYSKNGIKGPFINDDNLLFKKNVGH